MTAVTNYSTCVASHTMHCCKSVKAVSSLCLVSGIIIAASASTCSCFHTERIGRYIRGSRSMHSRLTACFISEASPLAALKFSTRVFSTSLSFVYITSSFASRFTLPVLIFSCRLTSDMSFGVITGSRLRHTRLLSAAGRDLIQRLMHPCERVAAEEPVTTRQVWAFPPMPSRWVPSIACTCLDRADGLCTAVTALVHWPRVSREVHGKSDNQSDNRPCK